MSDIIVARKGSLGCITLNRPKALNALNYQMVLDIHEALKVFAEDASVKAVLVNGAGDRGLCAGGDIRSIYEAQLKGDDLPARFWRDEYIMNAYIARYSKPYIAIMDGIVMGGGIGISAHGSHRIVTERTRAAMPEVAIGFSPDVGGTFLLSQSPGELGTFAGLTATGMNAADAIAARLADDHVLSSELPALIEDLALCNSPADIGAAIAARTSDPDAGMFATSHQWINTCFAYERVEDIVMALAKRSEAEAQKAATAMSRHCPKSLKVALRAMRDAWNLGELEPCLQMEYRVSLACIAAPDMVEGIRAVVIDKDQTPRWSPPTLAEVTSEMVNSYFASRPGDVIDFAEA